MSDETGPNVLSGEPVIAEVERRVLSHVRANDVPGGLVAEDRAELVAARVRAYCREIGGRFDPRVYRIATRLVPPALSALLHGFSFRDPHLLDVEDSIHVGGETEALRKLARLGTIILAPTHVSNLDSLVMGSVLYRLGLPPFAYAAGLNLYANPIVAFFVRHLGAYAVDRKNSDPLYLETLKTYAGLLLERGQHTLLFPGGTRSRSGAVERRLKKGLLGTAPIAFRRALESGAPRPRIYVVPCTLTYPLVLEAKALITDWLETAGGPARDAERSGEFDRPHRWLQFLRGFRRLHQQIYVRFSRPLDCLGHDVDGNGCSRGQDGELVDPASAIEVDGRVIEDQTRDARFTRRLAARIAEAYRRDNVALPSSLVALALSRIGSREVAESDLRRILGSGREALARLAAAGEIQLSPELGGPGGADPGEVLDRALTVFATYHPGPVVERRDGRVWVGDSSLVLYYGNRLDDYGLFDRRPLW